MIFLCSNTRLSCPISSSKSPCWLPFVVVVPVTNDSNRTEVSTSPSTGQSDPNKIVDGMDFGELCNDFECISSPLVEFTARQLVRDILELCEGNRAIGTYAVSVKYKVYIEQIAVSACQQAGKDVADSAKSLSSQLSTPKENLDVYPDPTGDLTKFFQRDDGFQRDLYQIALLLVVVYFVVQFLRTTL